MASTYLNGVLSCNSFDATDVGPFIGNGKVGAVMNSSNSSYIGADSCLVTFSLDSPKGKYKGNTIDTFNSLSINIEGLTLSNQFMDMNSAIFNSSGTTHDNVAVSCDMYCPQNLPFCFVQTVRLSAADAVVSNSNIQLYHTITAPDNIRDAEFNNNVIYNGQTSLPIYMLTAQGFLTGGRQIVSVSAYVFDDPYENLGFNIPIYETNTCFNIFNLSLANVSTTRMSIVTATMTSDDFDGPMEEAKRIVLNVLNKTVATVRSDHVRAWSNIWKSDVTIIPKLGIPAENLGRIETYKRALKTALYQIFSSVRSGVNLDINPSVLGFLDRQGQGLYTGDLTLIPLLLLLKPEYARAILDYRHKTLGLASKLAAGYGYSGAKYPYEDDRLGYKNALYWTTTSTMTVFNTAAISINVWNYYRTMQDMEWLRTTGYPILRANATFFVSLISSATSASASSSDYSCHSASSTFASHIDNVVGIAGQASIRDNTFTNALVKQALSYAVEASYELSLAVPEIWINMYHTLVLPVTSPDVYKVDDATPAMTDMTIPEPLVIFVPWFSDHRVGHHENVAFSGLDTQTRLVHNFEAYLSTSTNPLSEWMIGTLSGIISQSDPSFVANVSISLDDFMANHMTGSWGQFADTNIAAMFVLIIAQGVAKLNVVGGVSETRFYYAELGLNSLISANMPVDWDKIKIGVNGMPFITQNSLYYV